MAGRPRGRFRRILTWVLLGFFAWLVVLSLLIVRAGLQDDGSSADVAIVLGAAVSGNQPSPVFEQRIRHGMLLYRQGRVRGLIFTGGTASPAVPAEATVAKNFAMAGGIPAAAIDTEVVSRTTPGNLRQARTIMQQRQWRRALVVSDPLHLKRSLAMCGALQMDCRGSATRTSRYRSLKTRAEFLLRELFYYHVFLIRGA
ncbi:YdcF family protein [Altererythrobacter xixiisoli]|uniref:YdcF family protein n=1 Tax=Croceibacterium xixiisoli TaxID=1476466 RepID=A0A6I4U0G1_9SPHN|nr:YdcF family protein [Croceibacterium xixiisoli]